VTSPSRPRSFHIAKIFIFSLRAGEGWEHGVCFIIQFHANVSVVAKRVLPSACGGLGPLRCAPVNWFDKFMLCATCFTHLVLLHSCSVMGRAFCCLPVLRLLFATVHLRNFKSFCFDPNRNLQKRSHDCCRVIDRLENGESTMRYCDLCRTIKYSSSIRVHLRWVDLPIDSKLIIA